MKGIADRRMKRVYQHTILLALVSILIMGCGGFRYEVARKPVEPLILDVVYPRIAEDDSTFVISRVDSTFAFGSVQPVDAKVFVGDTPAKVWGNGAFLAYFPLNIEDMNFNFKAIAADGEIQTETIPFIFPEFLPLVIADSVIQEKYHQLPARLTVTSDHAVMRNAPSQAYWIFPPQGCVAVADSLAFPYYRIKLCEGLHGWIEDRFVTIDTTRNDNPYSVVNSVTVTSDSLWTSVEIPLTEPLLFWLDDKPESGLIALDLFGAVAKVDQIVYRTPDSLVSEIRWQQVQDDLLRFEIVLNTGDLWGYNAIYEENNLVVKLRHPPAIERKYLKGRTIALDPGHGGTSLGAIGPTRLLEKDVNLQIALKLKKLLEKEGARVILTRQADESVGIYERVDYALAEDAEVLLSIHNNALADGKNPFLNRGSAVYYYHSQSRKLARILHENLLSATKLDDHGFYYKNLALARPTELLAVLIECAFIMHPEEEILLRYDRFLESTARGLLKGLKEFYRQSKQSDERRYYPRRNYYELSTIKKPIWHPLTITEQNE